MPKADSDFEFPQELDRLAKVYAHMTDGELQKVAADFPCLSDPAQKAVTAELTRRGMDIPGNKIGNAPKKLCLRRQQRELQRSKLLHPRILAKPNFKTSSPFVSFATCRKPCWRRVALNHPA